MASVNDCLVQIQTLTKKNLEILKAINDSFFTKQNHLTVRVGEESYVMPSFISLENKINSLQASLENLVNAPTTGEAYFNFDGDSRAIEVRGYTHTPNALKLNPVDTFNIEQNDIFKDFLTPIPYVNISLSSIPNDITVVNVKKVIPKNLDLIKYFKSVVNDKASSPLTWADLYKKLSIYREDTDYIMYDTVRSLPIHENIGNGVYVIDEVVSDIIDENLNNYITIKLRKDIESPLYCKNLTYKRFDETIEVPLKVGDQLVTFDDSAKMEITEIRNSSNTIVVRVLYGEYLNLIADKEENPENINDLAKIKFFSPINFDDDKYINIPLEEDQYVFIAVAPLNNRMNIQSPWGCGLIFNTYSLVNEKIDKKFESYYRENVKNLGDVLFEVTSMFSGTVSKLGADVYENLIAYKPILDSNNIKVSQINTHLNNSITVKNIRALYSQKKSYNTELNEIQTKIANVNSKLAEISFDDTNNMRSIYVAELTEYNKKKNELVTSITKIIDEISLSANNSEIPIENAKYRIRGYYDIHENDDNIIGIEVQYRYKNLDTPQSNAESFNGDFIFSDWIIMNGVNRKKVPVIKNGNIYYELQEDNSNINEPSFNQIEIPISQGETVDIRMKVIYNYGYPFVETSSQWSEIVNVKFPDEFVKDVQILDIISENNNDIETNRFKNMLNDAGIPEHVGDKIIDQDIIYYHKPENIASGFYTAERRIIPLKDKLSEINSSIIALQDEVLGTSSSILDINIINGDVINKLYPLQINQISVESYDAINNDVGNTGSYLVDKGVVSTVLNISIANTSQRSIKIFSMFPGPIGKDINSLINVKYKKDDYCINENSEYYGIGLGYYNDSELKCKLQTANQFITFRIKDAFVGKEYYNKENVFTTDNILPLASYTINSTTGEPESEPTLMQLNENIGAAMYPMIREEYAITIDNSDTKPYILLSPGEEIIIPVIFEYKLRSSDGEKTISQISKIMSFDIRTSLYEDPTNYTFQVTAKLENTTQDKLINTNRKYIDTSKYHTTVVK